MYPNQGPPNQYGGQYPSAPFGSGYPSQMPQPMSQPMNQPFGAGYPSQPMNQPFGAGYPSMPQPFGAGYPGMPQSGMPQPGMPQPSMPQPGMPQPGAMPGMSHPEMPSPFSNNYQNPYPTLHPALPSMPQQPGSAPHQQSYGAPPAHTGSAPHQQSYGAPPAQPAYQPPQQGYGAPPSNYPSYPQLPQGGFGSAPEQPAQQHYQTPAYGAPPMHQPQYGGYGQPQQQSAPVRRGRPTVVPAANFNASTDAATLRKAMKGFGTDEDAIIEVLCRRTNAQRLQIAQTFKTAYGKDLISDIKSEVSGNFENLLVALLTETNEFYARELYESMYGAGTDEDVLIEVMCTMTNQEIRLISHVFLRLFGKNLEQELRSDTSGNFKRLMTSLSCGRRDESMVTDINSAQNDAQELKRAGIDKWGTDESAFNKVFCLRNHEQLKLVAQEYQKLTNHSLEQDIKKEFSGDIEDGLLSILRVAHNRPEFFARRIHKSMAGLGTNDRSLIRLVVSRCEIDMMDIKEEFQRYYGKSLKSFIKGDTSGHYKHALYTLIGENRS